MPFEHVIYIPAVFVLGLLSGYVWGVRSIRSEIAKAKSRAKE
jgi:hypothetical protein